MKPELIENHECENKIRLDTKNPHQWLKTLCAFSNSEGGTMNVGVSDSLEIVGFPLSEIDRIKRTVETICRNHTKPILKCRFEEVALDNNKDRFYLKIIVPKRPTTITWMIDQNTSPLLYIRHNGSTDLATLEEQIDLLNTVNLYEYDKVETGIGFSECEFGELGEEYQKSNGEILTKKMMIGFGLVTPDDYLTVAGVLFADNSISKNANLICTTWPTINKGSNHYTDSKSYSGSLIFLVHQALSYISSVTHYQFGGSKLGLYRQDTGSFDLIALREAIINALAHRDYKIDGNEIAINCFPDRIEITSPGYMLQSRNEIIRAKIDPDAFPSTRRNKTICSVFEKCRLMENKGSGFEKIVEDYQGLSEEYAPLISANRISFTIILKNKKYQFNGALTNNSIKTEDSEWIIQRSCMLSRQSLYAENPKYEEIEKCIVSQKSITIKNIASQVSLTSDGVKYNIRKMKDACLIRRDKNQYESINDIDRPADYLSLDKDIILKAVSWCKENFIPGNQALPQYTTYDYKQILEKTTNISLTNGQFKALMLLSGFEPIDVESLNWSFRIDESSPILKKFDKSF